MNEYISINGYYKSKKELNYISYCKQNYKNKKINNYENYIIFSNGSVLNTDSNSWLPIYLARCKYPQISIYINGYRKRFHIKELLKSICI